METDLTAAAQTPLPRATSADVHTPIDWNDAASLRRELARVDARRAQLLAALQAVEGDAGGEIVICDSCSGGA